MTRSDLISALTARFPSLSRDDSDTAVAVILDAIRDAVVCGDRVEIWNFGVFGTRLRRPEVGRNPRTGESISVPQKRVPVFKAGKTLKVMAALQIQR